jgi:hypothetical protein
MTRTDDTLVKSLLEKTKSTGSEAEASVRRECCSPASQEAVASAEAALGFPIEPFLRRVYLEVCNGGFGPGHGALSLTGDESLSSVYANFRAGPWPHQLLPVWNWGDATWSCVAPDGQIVTHDDVAGPTSTVFSLRSWLWSWVDGTDLWKTLYDDQETMIMNPFTRKMIPTKVRGRAKGLPWSTSQ